MRPFTRICRAINAWFHFSRWPVAPRPPKRRRLRRWSAAAALLPLLALTMAGSLRAAELSVATPVAPASVSLSTSGTLDWMHFGLAQAGDINGKAGTSLLTYTQIGNAPQWFGGAPEWTAMSFTGGEPAASGGPIRANVFWWGTAGQGFSFSAPADTSSRTLTVYLGGWNSAGSLQVSLSDGSVAPVNLSLSGSTIYDRAVTVVFAAASANQTVTLRFTQTGTSGLVALQAATLSGPAYNQAPVLQPVGDRSVVAGSLLQFNVSATDPDGPAPLRLSIDSTTQALPGSPTLTPTGAGTATFSWTPPAQLAGTTHNVTFRAADADGAGRFVEQTVRIQVTSAAAGSLGVTTAQSPAAQDLSTAGTLDWLHFGRVTATEVNGKAATTLLGYSFVGGSPGRYEGAALWSSLSWTGGEPVASGGPTNVNVFWGNGAGRGFSITAPADTVSRTLTVYLGGWNSTGALRVSLSDGSAAEINQNVSDTGLFARAVTVTYAAASAGQTLTFSFIQSSSGGLVGVQGATLAMTTQVNQPPVLATIGNRSVTANQLLRFNVGATDDAPLANLVFAIDSSVPALPAGATFTNNGNGTATFDWTPGTADVGAYAVRFSVRDLNGSGLVDSEDVTLRVDAPSGGGTLGVALQTQPATVNLSAMGTADWMHFGLGSGTAINRKATTPKLTYTALGGSPSYFPGATGWAMHTWVDGTPVGSAGPVNSNVFWPLGTAGGFRFVAPADTTPRTLTIYAGGYASSARISAALSDGSATIADQTMSGAGLYTRVITVTYSAASPGQTLTLTVTQTTADGLVALQAAALSQQYSLALPFSDDFASGQANNWTFFNQSPVSANWQVQSQELRQLNTLETVPARVGTYHLGALAVLEAGYGLTDYEVRVSARFTGTATDYPEDLGIAFRFVDLNNYYRLSLNARNGSTRLEKRAGGVFSTLSVNSRGYVPGEVQNFAIKLRGSQILVEVNNDPLFAVTDTSIPSGTIGLYTKARAGFDNVSIVSPSAAPEIVLSSPRAHMTQSGTTLTATAQAANVPSGGTVSFQLDGGATLNDSSAPYQVTFTGVQPGDHTVSASLRSGTGVELDRDTNVMVGVGGEYFVQIGDSITNGSGDGYAEDNTSAKGRYQGVMGQQAQLVDLLEISRGGLSPVVVFNEGMGGDASDDAAFERIVSIRERYPDMDTVLIGLGTNDTFIPIPSGLGCSGTACNGTYKGNLQALIDRIVWADYPQNTQPTFVRVRVALPPPEFTQASPWNSPANERLREYIAVIRNELTGIEVGPDLFSYFMPSADQATHLRSLFADALHPNGLGFQALSTLWHNNLEPAQPATLPFVLGNLQSGVSTALQQDLVGNGDPFRADTAGYVVTGIPAELANGRWLKTQNNATSAAANYLSFRTDRAIDLYIAYDGGATQRPAWMSAASFVDTGMQVNTSDPNGPVLRLYRASFAANATVTLGGNLATGAAGADTNYVTIVVEQ